MNDRLKHLVDQIDELDRQYYLLLIIIALVVIALTSIAILGLAWYAFYTKKRHEFAGKTCCVVGAAKGIGRGVALTLARKGAAKLVLVDMASCDETKEECVKAGCPDVVLVQCDVSDRAQLSAKFDDVLKPSDFVSLVVDCAGVVAGKRFDDLAFEEFERVIKVNLIANYALLKRFLPAMLDKRAGCFVGISSLMGLMGGARLSDYCASKFGLVGLFEALRMEFGQSHPNVSFVTVCPYAVDTGMFEGIFEATFWTRMIRKIFPLLKTMDVAESVVLAAERGTTVAVLPFLFGPLINIVRCLPSPLYEFVLTLMGGREGMNQFHGKSPIWAPQQGDNKVE